MIPPYTIHVQCDEPGAGGPTSTLVWRAAIAALQHQSAPYPSELTLLLTSDDVLRELNRRFLGQDFPADVLSFPAQEQRPPANRQPAGATPQTTQPAPTYLGDIAISLPRAHAQAPVAGHSVEQELALLAVHGVLHLLGHDHATRTEKARMWRAQKQILLKLFPDNDGS